MRPQACSLEAAASARGAKRPCKRVLSARASRAHARAEAVHGLRRQLTMRRTSAMSARAKRGLRPSGGCGAAERRCEHARWPSSHASECRAYEPVLRQAAAAGVRRACHAATMRPQVCSLEAVVSAGATEQPHKRELGAMSARAKLQAAIEWRLRRQAAARLGPRVANADVGPAFASGRSTGVETAGAGVSLAPAPSVETAGAGVSPTPAPSVETAGASCGSAPAPEARLETAGASCGSAPLLLRVWRLRVQA